ncbi:MAG: hypothetical protein IKY04_05450, partial [Lachnospiraceae bacterium]|nr:hypothetical protein [Lachnospiraceae bacterium]
MKKGKFTGSLKLYAKRLVTGTLALSMAMAFTPGMTAKAATASDIAIALDGETTDWDYIQKFVVDEDGFSQAAAFVTDDALYVMRELSDATGWGNDHIFIDADGNHTNGCYNAGIDFMLEGTDLYYYTGSGGDFGWGGSQPKEFFRSTDGVIAEYKFPLDSLGVKAPVVKDDIRVHIGCLDSNWGSLCDYPAGSTTLVKVPTLEEAFVSSNAPAISDFDITANGSLKAISTETMPGGTVAFFSAQGGNGEYKYNFASSKTYGKDNSRFVIEGNKLIVKDRLLAPGTYYVYVKVTSDIRSEKKAFVIEVDGADKTTVVNESIFSGQDGQWFAVNHNTANSTPNLTELKAATDGYNLFAYLKAEAISDEAEIFVSTSTQGKNMSDVWDDGNAVDYKVSANDGTVYKYDGENWNSVGSAAISKSKTQVEVQIPLDLLGKTEGDFLVGARDVKDGEEGYLPNTGNAMLYCVTPNMSTPPSITVDGNADDWVAAGLDNLRVAHGSGTVGDLYAFRDSENVYAMTTISVSEGGWEKPNAVSTNFLINADGNAKTGCQHATIKESGFEFLIQDWCSNDYGSSVKNVEAFIYTGTSGDHHQIAESKNGGPCYKVYSPVGGDQVTVEWYLPISLMQRAMDESDCGAVSDDLYVAVDRADPTLDTGTEGGSASNGSSFALIPKYQVKLNLTIDGNFADWDSISNRAYNTSADTTCNLQATKSADRLYTLVTNGEGLLNTVNLYYISTGKDTGYDFSTYKNIDYIVRDAELFPVIADNEIGESLGAVWMNYYHDSLEMQLHLSQIGNPDKVEIAWRGIDGTYAIPADGLMAVTATCELGKDAGYYYPTEDFSSFGNPYKGWVGWAGEFVSDDGKPTSAQKYESGDQMFERSAVYLAVRWREYEPTKGKYTFDDIKKKYNLDFWKNKGVRINLRFVMDNPEGLGVKDAKDYGVVVNKDFIKKYGL